jgi:hypothetical protein
MWLEMTAMIPPKAVLTMTILSHWQEAALIEMSLGCGGPSWCRR